MRVVLLYRPKSEFARGVEEFVHEYERRDASRHIELLDYDSREGQNLAGLYEIYQHPALLVLADDGKVIQMWMGPQLPLMDELAAYASSGGNMFLAEATASTL